MNNVVFSDHARKEMLRRNITQLQIEEVLQSSEQIISVNEERSIYQSRLELNQKQYLLMGLATAPWSQKVRRCWPVKP